MNGKKKCDRLRAIRRMICVQNGIPFTEEPCTSSGDGCIGTCPKCDLTLRHISSIIAERRLKGERVNLQGASALYQSWQAQRGVEKLPEQQ